MTQLKRKPIHPYWHDSMPLPLRTSGSSPQEFHGQVHSGMPQPQHAMDHPAIRGAWKSRTLTPQGDEPYNCHQPRHDNEDMPISQSRPCSAQESFQQMPMDGFPPSPVSEDARPTVVGHAADVEDMSFMSTRVAPSPPPPPPQSPPNGGTAAWLQVVGAFLLFFSSW